MIRVLVADDNAVIRSGLRSVLELCADIQVVAEAATGRQALRAARQQRCDVVLLDVRMPVRDGLSVVAPLRERARVLMLTYAEEPAIVTQAIRRGANGYLVHGRFSVEELAGAVREVAAGRSVLSPAVAPVVFEALRDGDRTGAEPAPAATRGALDGATTGPPGAAGVATPGDRPGLTERERDVMGLLVRGLANRAIAQRLYVSEKTVKNHLNRTYAKLGVTTRAEAMALWLGVR